MQHHGFNQTRPKGSNSFFYVRNFCFITAAWSVTNVLFEPRHDKTFLQVKSSQVKSSNIYLKSDYLYNMVTQAPKRFFFRLTYIKYHSHIYHNNFNMLNNTKIKLYNTGMQEQVTFYTMQTLKLIVVSDQV